MKTALYVIGCLLLTLLFIACASPERQAAQASFADAYNAATSDGVISPDEAKDLAAKWKLVQDSPSDFSWATVGAAAGTALLAVFPMLRYLPNGLIIGKQEAAHLDAQVAKVG